MGWNIVKKLTGRYTQVHLNMASTPTMQKTRLTWQEHSQLLIRILPVGIGALEHCQHPHNTEDQAQAVGTQSVTDKNITGRQVHLNMASTPTIQKTRLTWQNSTPNLLGLGPLHIHNNHGTRRGHVNHYTYTTIMEHVEGMWTTTQQSWNTQGGSDAGTKNFKIRR